MQSVTWYISRLRSMDGREIAWRIRRAADDYFDVVRGLTGTFPSVKADQLVGLGSFKPGFSCRPAITDCSYLDKWRDRLVSHADQVLEDRLSFFDLEDYHVGSPPDWHKDHASGRRGPARPCVFVDYRDFDTYGDCKLVWEPNRHHQLVVLSRAYAVTGRAEYAEKVVALLGDWLEANPFGFGMNWKSPLEIGIRLINWVWAIDLIRDSGVLTDEAWTDVQNAVYRSIWDVRRKYSQGSSANNHLIGEAAGVFVAASYFDGLPGAAKFAAEAWNILEREIVNQSFPDGCTREHAFGYQVFVIQFFTIAGIVRHRRGQALPDAFTERLRKLYLFVADISRDTGRPPSLGDADDGYILDLGDKPGDLLSLIAAGAIFLDEPDLSLTRHSETCYWLFGRNLERDGELSPTAGSRAYVDSGYFILRSNSGDGRPRLSCIFDCAELGYGSIAAHGHADCLSITLNVDDQEIFVDSGTYDYFSFPEWRDYFRSTQAHNTIVIDGKSQSTSAGPFLWGRRAEATLLDWADSKDETTVIGLHDGYSSDAGQIVHRRALRMDKLTPELTVVDEIDSDQPHDIARHFHLAPECHAEIIGHDRIIIRCGVGEIELRHDAESATIETACDHEFIGWVSRGYHQKSASSTIVLRDSTPRCGPFSVVLRLRQRSKASQAN